MSSNRNFLLKHLSLISSEEKSPHLFVQHITPKVALGEKVTHVIFQHGAIEYHKRHNELLEFLACELKTDYIISTMDLVGHGKSGGERGHVSSFDIYLKDFENFLNHCKDEYHQEREVDIVLISHSMGGLIVLNSIFDENIKIPFEIKKTIFCNPCIRPTIKIPSGVRELVDSMLSRTLGRMRIPLIYNGQDLTHDPEKIIEFTEDPLISKAITINMGLEILKACTRLGGQSYFYPHPALFLLSGDDRVVDREKTEVFLSGMEKDLLKRKFYPRMLHDLLNETCRSEVFKEIISYIKN